MDVKVVVLPENLHSYLIHVVESYSRAGIDPNECSHMAQLWDRVNKAQAVDYSKLGPVKVTDISPDGVELEIPPA